MIDGYQSGKEKRKIEIGQGLSRKREENVLL